MAAVLCLIFYHCKLGWSVPGKGDLTQQGVTCLAMLHSTQISGLAQQSVQHCYDFFGLKAHIIDFTGEGCRCSLTVHTSAKLVATA